MLPYRTMIVALALPLLQSDLGRGQNPVGGAVTVSTEDRKFILEAAQSGLHEVQMGMLGVELAPSELARFSIQTDVGLRVAVLIDVIKRCGDLTSGRLP